MGKRIAVLIVVVGVMMPLGAAARARHNFALSADPDPLDFGRVNRIQGVVPEVVTITNESAEPLSGGRYVILGDVNMPAGFSIETRLSTCVADGDSLAGHVVFLGSHRSCTFHVLFDPTQLRSGEYTARLKVTIERNTLRVHVTAHLVR
jgi:hypothetical protein